MAQARTRLLEVMRQAKEEMQAEHQRILRGHENALFGVHQGEGDSVAEQRISHRDAQERASRLTSPRQAREALDRAQVAGDTQLAGAIAQHSLAQGWHDVADKWAADNPALTSRYAEYKQMAGADDRMFNFVSSAAIPGTPPELNGMNSWAIQNLAAETAQAAGQDGA